MSILPDSPTRRRWLLVILLAGAMLRGGTVLFFQPPLISDDKDYDALAHSLACGDGYKLDGKPTAYRLPGYPVIVAAAYSLFGETRTPVRIVQGLADLASCVLLFGIGRRLFSERIGLAAAAVLAFFPIQIFYVSCLMSETIFTTLLLSIVFLALGEREKTSRWSVNLLLGALIGASVLVRSATLLLPILIFVWRWKEGVAFRANLRSIAIVVAAMIMVTAPWLLRNYSEFHRVSLTSNAGVNFWIGNHSGASGGYSFPKENNPLTAVEDDFQRSDLGTRLGFQFIASKPAEFALLLGKKFVRFFSPDYWLMMVMQYKPEWASAPNAATIYVQFSIPILIILHLPYVIVVILGIFGSVCNAAADEKQLFSIRSLLLYWLFAHLVIFADARFRFPVVPFLILAAVYGWYQLRAGNFRWTRVRSAAFFLLTSLIVGGWIGEYAYIRAKADAPHRAVYRTCSTNEAAIVRSHAPITPIS